MAKSPDFTHEKALLRGAAFEIRRNVALLNVSSLQSAYTEALERCRLGRDGRPRKAANFGASVAAVEEGEVNEMDIRGI